MLDHDHNLALVAASFALALMAGFTGLSLTRGASGMAVPRRKLAVSLAAIALGGGIWSMHFVAMLGLRLPVAFYYDALVTLISALVAILLTGIALLIVHFGDRTPARILAAGVCLGIGIAAMHYIGMSGMQVARPVHAVAGVVFAVAASVGLCVASVWLAYGAREARNILLGTLGFGISVFAVHFIAMAGTHFEAVPEAAPSALRLSNDVLAFGVTLSAFAISGAFLLMGVTFDLGRAARAAPEPDIPAPPVPPDAPAAAGRLPFEREGRIHFVADSDVAAIRAEGHYTYLYHADGRLFCPWSISQAQQRIANADFVKCHRSYLVNTRHVASFERRKDTGICYFDAALPLEMVPVSRSYLKEIRSRLGA